MAISLPIISTFDGKGVSGAIAGIQNLGSKLLGLGAIVAGAFAVRAIVDFGRESIAAAEAVQVANRRLEAVAKATNVFGAETGKVTEKLIKFAESQEMIIGQDAEIIKGVQAQLLSFKQLSESADETGGVFDRVTKAAFDMAAAGFGSAESNAIALGKAFEDPIKGLTALRRSGTIFTEEQQNLIKTLVDSGDLLGAQTVILNELESQYGGTAEATATWSDKLTLAFDNVKEAAGKSLTPAFEQFAQYMINEVVPPLTKFFEEDFPGILIALGPIVEGVKGFFSGVGDTIREAFDIGEDETIMEGLLTKLSELKDNPEFTDFIQRVSDIFKELVPDLTDAVFQFGELALKLTPLLTGALEEAQPLLEDMASILDDIGYFLNDIVDQFGTWEGETPDIIKFLDSQLNPMGRLKAAAEAIATALDAARRAWEKFRDSGAPGLQVSGGRRYDLSGQRALGGPVMGNRNYLVGENGPEIFTPSSGGMITPNNMLGAGGGATYNITINAGIGTDPVRVGEYVVSAIKRYERASGKVFASA